MNIKLTKKKMLKLKEQTAKNQKKMKIKMVDKLNYTKQKKNELLHEIKWQRYR